MRSEIQIPINLDMVLWAVQAVLLVLWFTVWPTLSAWVVFIPVMLWVAFWVFIGIMLVNVFTKLVSAVKR